jgi:hypothetical protein
MRVERHSGVHGPNYHTPAANPDPAAMVSRLKAQGEVVTMSIYLCCRLSSRRNENNDCPYFERSTGAQVLLQREYAEVTLMYSKHPTQREQGERASSL